MSSIHNIEEALLVTYLFVCDFLKTHPHLANWRRSNNRQPDFTDAEVITMALMQGTLECSTLKQAYRYIRHNHPTAFPHLISYPRWIARLHQVQFVVGHLLPAALAQKKMPGRVYIVDTKPIPVCKLIRAVRVRLLREEGAYWGKGSTGWYFGFKLHLVQHWRGGILSVVLTPANISELDPDVMVTLCSHLNGGLMVGDEGYESHPLRPYLKAETGMGLLSPPDVKKRARRRFLHRIRKRIETTLSQLWRQMLDRVFSRSFLGLWNTLLLKMLHHNLRVAGILA
jgi:hypothetical protein